MGSVSPNRAGMASGIDMSARLTSLAINIALMGLILLEGVHSYLTRALSSFPETSSLRLLAAQVAGGNIGHLTRSGADIAAVDPHGVIVHAALVHGFGFVMLYGAIGAWAFALLSVAAFDAGMHARRQAPAADNGTRHPNL
ncbi:hypothetical protein [Cupriavidus nantongensis]